MNNRLLTLENSLLKNNFKLDESIETILINESSFETRKDQVLAIQNTLTGLQQFTNIYLKDKTPKAKKDIEFYFKSYIKLVQHLQAAHMTVHSKFLNIDLDQYLALLSSDVEPIDVTPKEVEVKKTETVATVESPKAEEIKEVVNEEVKAEEAETKPVAKTIKAK